MAVPIKSNTQVQSGATLNAASGGTVDANSVMGKSYSGAPTSAGQIPIYDGSQWVPGDPLVQGLVAAGASLSSVNPVYIGGVDGSGNSKGLVLDSSGRPTVNVASGQTIGIAAGSAVIGHVIMDSGSTTVVTGTVSMQGGKTNNNATPGATNVGTLPALCNTSAPTWTDGNQTSLSVDTSGNLRVTGGGGGTQYADGVTQATPTGTVALGKNASNVLHAVSLDASGYLNINVAASSMNDPAEQTPGSTASGIKALQVGGTDGTNVQAFKVESSSNPNLRVGVYNGANQMPAGDASGRAIFVQFGSAQSVAQSGNWTSRIVGNAGATLDATIGVATAPTNCVVTGLVYNNSNPAPTNGQSMALQGDLAGNLKIAFGSTTQNLSAWISSTALNATQTLITQASVPSIICQLVQTTTLTAGAVTFELTYDDSNWVTVPATQVVDPGTLAQIAIPYTVQASTNKAFLILLQGARQVRAKLSTQITGSGSVTPFVTNLAYEPTPLLNSSGAAKVDGSAVTQPVSWSGQTVTVTQSTASSLKVDLSGTAANATAIKVDGSGVTQPVSATQTSTWTVQPGNTANTTPWLVSQVPTTAGGCLISRTLSANNTTGILAKNAAGQVYGWAITNTNASPRFVKLYNKASAATVGTDTPVVTLLIPGNANGSGQLASFTSGIQFATGVSYGITTGVADNDTGAPAANEVIVNLFYK